MIAYASQIDLFAPFVPTTGQADISDAITALHADPKSRSFINQYDMPSDPAAQRKWLQAALTIRPSGDLPNRLALAMDRLLQAELRLKSVTDAHNLPRLDTPYPASQHVSIWDGDITTLAIGAITNAANTQMLGCFQPFHACIDNVIQCVAGPQLREDCARIIEDQGYEETTGTAKITRAYNLPSEFVIHTVGPIVPDHRPTTQQVKELASCYTSCLSLSAKAGVKSLAFCGISTGVFGYPPEQAAMVALTVVSEWLSANPDVIDHVVFNTFGSEATAIYERATASWM